MVEVKSLQLFILGITFSVITFLLKAPIRFAAGLLSFWIQTRAVALKYINKTSGVISIGLGLKLVIGQKA